MSAPIRLLVVGAGDRGSGYAAFTKTCPERARVVAVAEPRDAHRERLAREHGIPATAVFRDWREAAAAPPLADAAIIATPDAEHRGPATALAARGYHLLLEKPMAPDEAGCRAIVQAVKDAGVLFAVGHVLRYTAYTRRLKALLDAGTIGELASVQHIEGVGYWHMAHSFVRGNWRNERLSAPMLLAKSSHDLDWLRHVVGSPGRRVASFGSRRHFRPDKRPAGAADRCLDCPVEADCPYSAPRIYLGFLARGVTGWPVSVVALDPTADSVTRALREGPYGRCVYACDNDVVDHQVLAIEFANGVTAAFTMTAFTPRGTGRVTRLFGSRGEIAGDSSTLSVHDFLTDTRHNHETRAGDGTLLGGHGGGDGGLMDAFLSAVEHQDPRHILSGPDETLESHLLVFAAERARREGRVVEIAGGH